VSDKGCADSGINQEAQGRLPMSGHKFFWLKNIRDSEK